MEEGRGVFAHVVGVQEVEASRGVEVFQQCGFRLFQGRGGCFRIGGVESRVLPGFKAEVEAQFSNLEHCGWWLRCRFREEKTHHTSRPSTADGCILHFEELSLG